MRVFIASLAAGTLVTGMAQASSDNCATRDNVIERLQSGYNETFAGGGFHNGDRVFEIWVAEDDSTWTLLMTQADGVTCIVATGTNWRDAMPGKVAKGIPG